MKADVEIIITAILIAAPAALLGCFLVARKMAMLGDAISHAVLPGIVIAFLISGSRDQEWMLLGAIIAGFTVSFLIQMMQSKIKLQQDASIGISYTFLFAIGVILVSRYGAQVDLDQDCVLYGEIAYVPLDRFIVNNIDLGPKQIWISSALLLAVSAFIYKAYKALLISSFDSSYASALGFSVITWHYLLMGAVSATTVISFESVGAILVVALLVVPAATAYLIANHFKKLLFLSLAFAISSVLLGYLLAYLFNGSIAGAIAFANGLQFMLVLVWKRFPSGKLKTEEIG